MMKRIYFTWRHNGKRDYVIIDDRREYYELFKKNPKLDNSGKGVKKQ